MIIKVVANYMSVLYDQLEDLESQMNLRTASGLGLDRWGDVIQVPRKQALKSSSLGGNRPVRFTNSGSSPVTIPANTRVWSSINPQLAYFTVEGVTIPAGSFDNVHVIAAEEGDIYNIPPRRLDKHSYVGSNISVTNILPISNGSFVESDDSYRERLVQAFRSRVVFNSEIVIALVRGIPNVKDALLLNEARGPGTFDVIVIPYNTADTSDVVSAAQAVLAERVTLGTSVLVKAPEYRRLEIQAILKFKQLAQNKEAARSLIREQIAGYIDALQVEDGSGNGTLYIEQLKSIVSSASPDIISSQVVLKLDGSLLGTTGQVNLNIGEKVTISSLVVE
jgi:uncharacterized phage protein gp47/JayE